MTGRLFLVTLGLRRKEQLLDRRAAATWGSQALECRGPVLSAPWTVPRSLVPSPHCKLQTAPPVPESEPSWRRHPRQSPRHPVHLQLSHTILDLYIDVAHSARLCVVLYGSDAPAQKHARAASQLPSPSPSPSPSLPPPDAIHASPTVTMSVIQVEEYVPRSQS